MIYFLIYLFAEVIITIEIASMIGALATFLEIVASALLGVFVLMNFRHALAENLYALQTRRIDVQGFSNRNLRGLLGAFLLIVPGFLSDLTGIIMLLGLFGSLIVNRFGRKYHTPTPPKKDDYVIDAEIIDDTTAQR